MALPLLECEEQALKLPPPERAVLAEHLIASLDDLSGAQIDQMWIDEADRRFREYKNGSISARPAEDVLRDARAAIK
ncbi:MAG: addiction module antitoxin RelB [Spartobacteria bacterium]|nr:addiction module antitoxin RelB [Spartobacteria bacterium]